MCDVRMAIGSDCAAHDGVDEFTLSASGKFATIGWILVELADISFVHRYEGSAYTQYRASLKTGPVLTLTKKSYDALCAHLMKL